VLAELEQQVNPEKWPIAPHVRNLEASIIREILKIAAKPGVISFGGGLPAAEVFPLKELSRIASEVIDKYESNALQYSLSQGLVPFRELLAKRETEQGAPTTPGNILVTCGAQQAIELLARTFIDPGDYVLTENPTYLGALQVFNYYRARYCTVEMDHDGMLVDQLEDRIKKYKPKLIYTVSNFQNPTGITMSLERRKGLLEIAAKYNLPIIDDNPYGEIRFTGDPLPTLKSLGGDGVVALRTYSKTLAPGLRVGWMNAAASMIRMFEKVRQCVDLHTSTFGQYLCYEFTAQGLLEPQVERVKENYRAKREAMLKALEESFPEGITWTRPEGGMFLWLTLPETLSAKDLLPAAIDRGVAYVYGSPFYPNDGGENTMRLNYSSATLENIAVGIKRLGDLLKENM
jgi:2-aminoadipate transaminase